MRFADNMIDVWVVGRGIFFVVDTTGEGSFLLFK